jgi:hypothetical protein
MAIKELLTDLACKNAATTGTKIRKLHDGQGLYLWVYKDGGHICNQKKHFLGRHHFL